MPPGLGPYADVGLSLLSGGISLVREIWVGPIATSASQQNLVNLYLNLGHEKLQMKK